MLLSQVIRPALPWDPWQALAATTHSQGLAWCPYGMAQRWLVVSSPAAMERAEARPGALHAFAIIVGIAGAATVIGSFVGSLPSLAAVILNYLKRGEARSTWVASHYRWQIRTFWFALLWALIGWGLVFTIVGVVVGVPILLTLTLWLLYRIGRGWLRLRDRRPMYAL